MYRKCAILCVSKTLFRHSSYSCIQITGLPPILQASISVPALTETYRNIAKCTQIQVKSTEIDIFNPFQQKVFVVGGKFVNAADL